MSPTKSEPAKVHVVVWLTRLDDRVMAYTDRLQPAVFQHAEDAELFAAQRREQFPEMRYAVLDCPVQ